MSGSKLSRGDRALSLSGLMQFKMPHTMGSVGLPPTPLISLWRSPGESPETDHLVKCVNSKSWLNTSRLVGHSLPMSPS